MRIHWPDVLRHGLQVLAFCAVVAVVTTLIWPASGYGHQLFSSVTTGLLTWGVIEFGRLLVPAEHCHPSTVSEGPGWPKGWRGVALTAVGIAVGFAGNGWLVPWLLGDAGQPLNRDLTLALVVTVVAGTVASFYFHARGRQAAMQAQIAAAERDATEAHLRLLQSQLEPHMLFNTLANLRALIGVDPVAAQQMLDQLNDYLRATLSASRATAHPLAAEFERLRDYLGLMAVRMGPRLSFELQLPPALRELPVPPLLLQPLVENALKHGLEPRVEGGRVQVSAVREGDALVLKVHDPGVGFDTDALAARAGRFGMAQVHERVDSAYGGRGQVDFQSRPGAGTTVRLVLPLQPQP